MKAIVGVTVTVINNPFPFGIVGGPTTLGSLFPNIATVSSNLR